MGECAGNREQMLRRRDRRPKNNSGNTETETFLVLVLVLETQLKCFE